MSNLGNHDGLKMAILITSRMAVLSVLMGLLCGLLNAQVISPELDLSKPLPPASGIYDPNGFFRRFPEVKNRISNELVQLREQYGYEVYLVVEPVIIGSTVTELAGKMRSLWIPDGNGLIVVFEANSRAVAYGWDVRSEDHENAHVHDSEIPTHEISAVIRRSVSGLSVDLDSEAYIDGLMQNIVRECRHYFHQRSMPLPEGRNRMMLLLALIATFLLGAIAFLLGIILRRVGRIGNATYRFAENDASERFGAPAGTCVTSRSFKDEQG